MYAYTFARGVYFTVSDYGGEPAQWQFVGWWVW